MLNNDQIRKMAVMAWSEVRLQNFQDFGDDFIKRIQQNKSQQMSFHAATQNGNFVVTKC